MEENKMDSKFVGCKKRNGTILRDCETCPETVGSRSCERFREKYYMVLITAQGKQDSCWDCECWIRTGYSEQILGNCKKTNDRTHKEHGCVYFSEVTA